MKPAIETLAAELSVETDRMTQAIKDVESAINAINLGVPATVPFGARSRLGYGKVGDGTWCLFVADSDAPDATRTALTRTSRVTRREAIECLPALRDALFNASEMEYARVRAAAAECEAFLKTVRQRE